MVLNKEFEPYKQRGKLLEYEALHQDGESPRRYLGDVRQLERIIEDTYPKQAIAERYVNRLDIHIRDIVRTKFQGKIKDIWYDLLDTIAECAESVWMNHASDLTAKTLQSLSFRNESYNQDTLPTQQSSGRTDGLYQTSAATRPKYDLESKHFNCDHHGPNNTHETRDCLVLNGQQWDYAHEQGSVRRGAMFSAGSQANSNRWGKHRQQAARPFHETRPNRPRCLYCDRYGDNEDSCIILHLELAEPGCVPSGAIQRAQFLEDRAKAAGVGQPGGSNRGDSSPTPSETGGMSGSQARRVNLTTCTAADSDFDNEEDYVPSERRSVAFVTYSHCCATLLQ